MADRANIAGAAVVYGFLDTHLTDPVDGGWDSLVGNRALAYYVDPEAARRLYAANSPAQALILQIVGQVRALSRRYAIWAKVELLRRKLGEMGMPAKETNRFGRTEDFALLECRPRRFCPRM